MKQLICLAFFIFSLNSCARFAYFFNETVLTPFMSAPYPGSIPKRQKDAISGSQFISISQGMPSEDREEFILKEMRHGNIPDFLRELVPVHVSMKKGDVVTHRGTIWVMPDYLSIGHEGDFVRIPMSPITAQRVADYFGFILPTKKIVDEIYKQAEVKLTPTPLPAGDAMRTNDYYLKHNEIIGKQLKTYGNGYLTAGHKKDVILSNRLAYTPRRVAIYGWHKLPIKSGDEPEPIQSVSLVHGHRYVDYSHGIRLIAKTMLVDGNEMPVAEVMQNSELSALVSDDGALILTRIATDCPES